VLQVFEMGGQIQAKGSLHEPTLTYHFGLDLVAIAQVQILHFFYMSILCREQSPTQS
jgi:hypothetical protein